jgi:hypothetical protein
MAAVAGLSLILAAFLGAGWANEAAWRRDCQRSREFWRVRHDSANARAEQAISLLVELTEDKSKGPPS